MILKMKLRKSEKRREKGQNKNIKIERKDKKLGGSMQEA